MLEGFTDERVEVADGVVLRVRVGGEGPPVVLLHGHPRTHATWYRVAPLLVAAGSRVVLPDLRGYGASTAPAPRADHAQASKRAMAADVVALLRSLGHESFAVVGHDRGSYVALRCALDHPGAVARLTVVDGVPIGEALRRADARFAEAWWHWFFYARPDLPERAIDADVDAWYRLDGRARAQMGEAFDDVRAALHRPEVVRAMLEDYRAGLGVDRAHDDADRSAGRTVACPVQVLWSARDDLVDLYGDVLAVWRPWVSGALTGAPVESGHHVAEEAPEELARLLLEHLRG
ncbi:alpha/beta hydrolase [Pseudokineococcus basanitobsidens]|uniref:Alpha/beta hydrolase n=1 Tax=Pseudokineococcus basanitobsidens TaxID=1926649 RepID=A0ABU8RJM5_9ACTN